MRIPSRLSMDERRATFGSAKVRLAGWLHRRRVPLGCTVVLLATGLAFSYLWASVVLGAHSWSTTVDLSGTFRVAQWVSWGDLGEIYTKQTGFIVFPGIAFLLAPIAKATTMLGLSVSYPLRVAHPSGWLLLGPVNLLLGALPLFALDAMAERLGVTGRHRVMLCAAEAVLVWPVVALWGHPEDPVALAFGVWALLATLDGRWVRGAWLWGLGIAFQPMVLLLLPIGIALTPRGRQIPTLIRAAIPTSILILPALITHWATTFTALVRQPTDPTSLYPTPWLSLSPVLTKSRWATVRLPRTEIAGRLASVVDAELPSASVRMGGTRPGPSPCGGLRRGHRDLGLASPSRSRPSDVAGWTGHGRLVFLRTSDGPVLRMACSGTWAGPRSARRPMALAARLDRYCFHVPWEIDAFRRSVGGLSPASVRAYSPDI